MNNFQDIYNRIGAFDIEYDTVFLSFNHRDKDFVLKMIKLFDVQHIKYWGMYTADGKDKSKSGDNYRTQIEEALRRTCVCVVFISKNTLDPANDKKNGVKEELDVLARMKRSTPVTIVTVYLDGLGFDDLNDEWRRLIQDPDNSHISYSYRESDGDAKIQGIFGDVCDKYLLLMAEAMNKQYEMLRDSKKIVDLMNDCVSYKCKMRSVSEDIKSGDEVGNDSMLREVHVLSDEIREYDCHPYSCVVISTNLVGNAINTGVKQTYNPATRGVKYFYYLTHKNVGYYTALRNEIEGFIRKSRESREKVVRLIRREYCLHNRLVLYFNEFKGLTQDGFKSKYRIASESDRKLVDDLFKEEFVATCFKYTKKNDEEVFRVPNEFKSWLLGTQGRYSYKEVGIAYRFIDFWEKLLGILQNMSNSNAAFVGDLETKVTSLKRLRMLEEWQEGKHFFTGEPYLEIKHPDAVKLIDFLLDGTVGEVFDNGEADGDKKFPKLAEWLMFERDSDDNVVWLDSKTADEALGNMHLIEIKDDSRVDLCSSFVLFMSDNNINNAGWYTTGESDKDGYTTNFVIAYELRDEKNEFSRFADVFKFLVELNPDSLTQLQGTKLLAYIKGDLNARS